MIRPVPSGEAAFRPTLYWYVTFRCNLSCKHCLVEASPQVDTTNDMSLAECITAAAAMEALHPSVVVITGGEPLIRKDLPVILQALMERDVPIAIESNGTLLTDGFACFIEEWRKMGARLTIGISVDGGDAQSHDLQRGAGTFARAVHNLSYLGSRGIPFGIQCVVNHVNISTLGGLFDLCRETGCGRLTFAFLNPVGRATQHRDELGLTPLDLKGALDIILKRMNEYPEVPTIIKLPPAMIPPSVYPTLWRFRGSMSGGYLSTSCGFPGIGILPDGDITICSVTRNAPELRFGNVRNNSLTDVWERHAFPALREQYCAAGWLQGICGDCVFQHGCKGSCRAWAYTEYGSFAGPHPLCAELERAGRFPDLYRISHNRAAAMNGTPLLEG